MQPALPLKPWLRAGFSQGSGDDTPGTTAGGRHSTFFQMLPTPTHLRAHAVLQHDEQSRPVRDRSFCDRRRATSVRTEVHSLSLTESKDLWYAGGGAYSKTVFGFQGRPSGGKSGLATLADIGADRALRAGHQRRRVRRQGVRRRRREEPASRGVGRRIPLSGADATVLSAVTALGRCRRRFAATRRVSGTARNLPRGVHIAPQLRSRATRLARRARLRQYCREPSLARTELSGRCASGRPHRTTLDRRARPCRLPNPASCCDATASRDPSQRDAVRGLAGLRRRRRARARAPSRARDARASPRRAEGDVRLSRSRRRRAAHRGGHRHHRRRHARAVHSSARASSAASCRAPSRSSSPT